MEQKHPHRVAIEYLLEVLAKSQSNDAKYNAAIAILNYDTNYHNRTVSGMIPLTDEMKDAAFNGDQWASSDPPKVYKIRIGGDPPAPQVSEEPTQVKEATITASFEDARLNKPGERIEKALELFSALTRKEQEQFIRRLTANPDFIARIQEKDSLI